MGAGDAATDTGKTSQHQLHHAGFGYHLCATPLDDLLAKDQKTSGVYLRKRGLVKKKKRCTKKVRRSPRVVTWIASLKETSFGVDSSRNSREGLWRKTDWLDRETPAREKITGRTRETKREREQ